MVLRLITQTPAELDVSKQDRVLEVLRSALADTERDIREGRPPHGIIVLFARDYGDNSFGESWMVAGLNALETIGLTTMMAQDVAEFGINGGPEHFDGPEEPDAAS